MNHIKYVIYDFDYFAPVYTEIIIPEKTLLYRGYDKGMLIVKSKLICDAIIGVTNFSL